MAIKVRKSKARLLVEAPVLVEPVAVSFEEHDLYGCAHCGFQSGSQSMSGGGTLLWNCGECSQTNVILFQGLTISSIGFGSATAVTLYPKLRTHPRKGTPKHGRADTRPEGGGEWFRSRGIGMDNTPGCFVCGGKMDLYRNISAFVQCKAAGERVITLFGRKGARLDYRDSEPDRIQVKVGACTEHLPHLEALHTSVCGDGTLTAEKIEQARS